jgi:hypothetical protein
MRYAAMVVQKHRVQDVERRASDLVPERFPSSSRPMDRISSTSRSIRSCWIVRNSRDQRPWGHSPAPACEAQCSSTTASWLASIPITNLFSVRNRLCLPFLMRAELFDPMGERLVYRGSEDSDGQSYLQAFVTWRRMSIVVRNELASKQRTSWITPPRSSRSSFRAHPFALRSPASKR